MNDQINKAYHTIDELAEQLADHHLNYQSEKGQALVSLCITQLQNLTAEVMSLEERIAQVEQFALPMAYRPAKDADESGFAEGEDAA